jgi:hypothetical protein
MRVVPDHFPSLEYIILKQEGTYTQQALYAQPVGRPVSTGKGPPHRAGGVHLGRYQCCCTRSGGSVHHKTPRYSPSRPYRNHLLQRGASASDGSTAVLKEKGLVR